MTTADQVSAEALATEAADARAGNQALNDNPNPSPAIEPGSSHQEPARAETTQEGSDRRKPYVNPRDAIIARVKAQREAQPANDNVLETDESGTFVPPFLKQGQDNQPLADEEDGQQDEQQDDAGRRRRDEKGRFAKEGQDETSDEPAKTYTLKVYGNDISVKSFDELAEHAGFEPDEARDIPEAKLIRIAQKALAAQQLLDEAKQGRKAARPQADQPANQVANDNLDGDAPQQQPADPRDRVREVVEKIQFGDPDEGATALKQLVQDSVKEGLQLTQQQTAEKAAEDEIVGAVNTFTETETNADLIKDGDLQGLFWGRYVVNEVKEALVKTGKVDREAVDKLVVDPRSAMVAVQAATMGELGISKPGDILNAAASKLRAKFGNAAPANTNQPTQTQQRPAALNDRLALKRGLVSQPSRAAAPQPAAAPKNGQDPTARSSVVAKIQQMRGQRPAIKTAA